MSAIAIGRLTEERKNWRKDHPPGFYAKPGKKADNSTNIMQWETGIPGKEGNLVVMIIKLNYLVIAIGTDWAGGVYKVVMDFPEEYPSKVIGKFCCAYVSFNNMLLD